MVANLSYYNMCSCSDLDMVANLTYYYMLYVVTVFSTWLLRWPPRLRKTFPCLLSFPWLVKLCLSLQYLFLCYVASLTHLFPVRPLHIWQCYSWDTCRGIVCICWSLLLGHGLHLLVFAWILDVPAGAGSAFAGLSLDFRCCGISMAKLFLFPSLISSITHSLAPHLKGQSYNFHESNNKTPSYVRSLSLKLNIPLPSYGLKLSFCA